jgi:hypothetical protein
VKSRREKGRKKPLSAKRRGEVRRELERFASSERFGADWVESRLRQAADVAWQGVIFPEDREALKAWEDRGALSRAADEAMARAVSTATGVSWDVAANRPSLLSTARGLVDAGFAPSVIRVGYRLTEHGAGSPWQSDDWHGRRGERPTLALVLETVGGVAASLKAQLERRRWSGLDDDERSAAESLGVAPPDPPSPTFAVEGFGGLRRASETDPPSPAFALKGFGGLGPASEESPAAVEEWSGPDLDTTWGRVARAAYEAERIGLVELIWMKRKLTTGANGRAEVEIGDDPIDGRMVSRSRGALERTARELGVELEFRTREEKMKQKGGDP